MIHLKEKGIKEIDMSLSKLRKAGTMVDKMKRGRLTADSRALSAVMKLIGESITLITKHDKDMENFKKGEI